MLTIKLKIMEQDHFLDKLLHSTMNNYFSRTQALWQVEVHLVTQVIVINFNQKGTQILGLFF